MRGLVWLAVVAACAVDVDPSNTRFACSEQDSCPGGFHCTRGVCEPLGTPDATPLPDVSPPPDVSPRQSCNDSYGDAPGYILCVETETACSFNALLEGGTCGELCPVYGGTCEGALDNESAAGTECTSTGVDTCATNRSSEICICSR